MSILIVSATTLEIEPACKPLKKKGADILIGGWGAAATVYAITKAVQKKRPTVIVQAGIGGCFNKSLPLGNVFSVSRDCFGDVGVLEEKTWRPIFDMGFAGANKKPFTNGWLKNTNKRLLHQSGLTAVSAVTVNEITTRRERILFFKQQGAVIESMEGAALHYVALQEKIPFLQVRAISNYVGERNKSKWNFKDAIANLNTEMMRLVTDLI